MVASIMVALIMSEFPQFDPRAYDRITSPWVLKRLLGDRASPEALAACERAQDEARRKHAEWLSRQTPPEPVSDLEFLSGLYDYLGEPEVERLITVLRGTPDIEVTVRAMRQRPPKKICES